MAGPVDGPGSAMTTADPRGPTPSSRATAIAAPRPKRLRLRRVGDTLWMSFYYGLRPSFTLELLTDIVAVQARLLASDGVTFGGAPVRRLVLASLTPKVFNLGGDLELFVRLIRTHDLAGLRHYGHLCVQALHGHLEIGARGVTTYSLLEGNALGGGLEAALTSELVIAEEGVRLGFPEARFGLYPGMGAKHFLAARMAPEAADELLRKARLLRVGEAAELGLVDAVLPRGEGRKAIARGAVFQSRRSAPCAVPLATLTAEVDAWAEDAARLGEADIQKMEKLVAMQKKLKFRLLLILAAARAALRA